jgi:signal peptidase I
MSDTVQVESEKETAETLTGPEQAGDVKPEPAFKKGVVREYFESGVVTLIMALFGMTFIVQAVKVPTGSMQNTIYVGDHLLVNKFIMSAQGGPYFPILPAREIRRGDIIVFKFPRNPETNYVKRVIGLPGETVEFNAATNRVYINGEELPENRAQAISKTEFVPLEKVSVDPSPGAKYTAYYIHGDDSRGYNEGDYAVSQPFVVPRKGDPLVDEVKTPDRIRIYDADNDGLYDSDQYFCMGDNRDNSQDSRSWGTVPRTNVVGRAMFVYWSLEQQPDPDASPLAGFFQRTIWSRTGKFIK